ncbi:MAG: hypothetical protein QG602_493, partial [Verrucomicrobiota bacterium]|nr:hypothetical protein [Verrucomicrobiota bacterium]
NPIGGRDEETLSGRGHTKDGPQFSAAPTGTKPRARQTRREAHDFIAGAEPNADGGQSADETQKGFAAVSDQICEGQLRSEAQSATDLAEPASGGASGSIPPNISSPLPDQDPNLAAIVEKWRFRQDMLRARQRLELQAQAVCRRSVEGDKVKAAKLWADVKRNPVHPLRGWLGPMLVAMGPLDAAKLEAEKELAKRARNLPVYAWAKGVSGLGDVSLAAIVGECAAAPGGYKSVSALWKRMGLAVIHGGRQRKVAGADALDHGYDAERRSLMWNIGGCLIKAQVRNEKGEDGKKIDGSDFAIGELGQVYLDRKRFMQAKNEAGEYAARAADLVAAAKKNGGTPNKDNLEGRLSPIHIHNDSKRYMEKRLLRQLWQEWRRASGVADPINTMPDVEYAEAAE